MHARQFVTLFSRRRTIAQQIYALFSARTLPTWRYEAWDFAANYQDSAGTLPVTALEQQVGVRLDKSKGLIRGAELFTDGAASFVGEATRVSPNVYRIVSSDGALAAVTEAILTVAKTYEITFNVDSITTLGAGVSVDQNGTAVLTVTTTGAKRMILTASFATLSFRRQSGVTDIQISGVSVKEIPGNHSIQITAASRPIISAKRNLLIASDTLSTQSVSVKPIAHTLSFTGTGTITLTGTSTAGPLVGTGAGDRVSLTFTPTAGSLTLTVSGSVTLAQLEYGSAYTRYQQNASASVYDAVGFPIYYAADGVDDGWYTAAVIDGTGSDDIGLFAAVTKLSDASAAIITELSANVGINNGSFYLSGPDATAANNFRFASKGTSLAAPSVAAVAAPVNAVIVGIGDISGDTVSIDVNNTVVSSFIDQGTGNYGSYLMYSMRRNNASLPFNGRMAAEMGGFGSWSAGEIALIKQHLANLNAGTGA